MNNLEFSMTFPEGYITPVPQTLDSIALKCGTDKSSKSHFYTKYYEMFFNGLRYDPVNILEIGVWRGESLKMWKEFFAIGNVFGIDYEEKLQYNEERIKTFIADQEDIGGLFDVCLKLPTPDIIIDDASHVSRHQISCCATLFRLLKPGGYYCIEDCLTSYNSTFVKPNEMPFLEYAKGFIGDVNMNGKIIDLVSDKTKALNKYNGTMFEETVEWVFYSTGLTIIKKMK